MRNLLLSLIVLFLGLGLDFFNILDPEISEPLYIFGFGLTVTAFILLFLKNASLNKTWQSFAPWWLIISTIIILATPTSNNTWMPLYSLEREGVTWIMGILFALISLGIIVWKSSKK